MSIFFDQKVAKERAEKEARKLETVEKKAQKKAAAKEAKVRLEQDIKDLKSEKSDLIKERQTEVQKVEKELDVVTKRMKKLNVQMAVLKGKLTKKRNKQFPFCYCVESTPGDDDLLACGELGTKFQFRVLIVH